MARTPKTTLDFISLDCKDGLTLRRLHRKYGKEGRYMWIELLRLLGRTSKYYVDLSQEVLAEDIYEGELFVNPELGSQILTDLAEWGNIDADLWTESKIIWCQDLIDRHSDTWNKRKEKPLKPDNRDGKAIPGDLSDGKAIPAPDIPQRKVKESKEEEKKAQDARAEFELHESSKEIARPVAAYFSIAEVAQHQKFAMIVEFCKWIQKNAKREFFECQFEHYQLYKSKSEEQKHGLGSYIGTPPDYGGAWNQCDWKAKNESYKPRSKFKTPQITFDKN